MKILTGALRGQPITFKPNKHLRPTADKTRQAIFNMLQGNLEGTQVLDLFSGTGALGFEALSNGAEAVTFVEIEKTQDLSIEKNLAKLGLYEKGEVIVSDALKAIERFSLEAREFDLILLDPPYDKGLGEKAMTALKKANILKKNGLIVYECRESENPKDIKGFERIKDKVYGDTRIVVYRGD